MMLKAETDSAASPAWFTEALAAPVTEGQAVVDGVPIAYRAWGGPGSRGVVLVHGGAAHSRWWDHIGPLLASDRRVVAIDLSGHGDSGRRESYSFDAWAREILAVAADAVHRPLPPGARSAGARLHRRSRRRDLDPPARRRVDVEVGSADLPQGGAVGAAYPPRVPGGAVPG